MRDGIDLAHQRAALRFSSSLVLAINSIVWSFSATRTRFRSQAGCADETCFSSRAAGKRRSCAGKFACKIQIRLLAPLQETLAVDVFGLVLAPSFLRANYSIPSFGNREIRP